MSINAVEQHKLGALMAMACERHVSVRLSYRASGGDLEGVDVKLADCADGVICVDGPEGAQTRFAFQPNRALMGYFAMDGRQYQFLTRAGKPPAQSGFLRPTSETTLTMALPPRMVEEQRERSDYRVELGDRYSIPISMVSAAPSVEGAKPEEARRYEATLDDISAGGIGVSGDLQELDDLSVDHLYCASFQLPENPHKLNMLVRVCHVLHIPGQDVCKVGCVFDGGSGSNQTRYIDQIVQFVMREQLELAKLKSV